MDNEKIKILLINAKNFYLAGERCMQFNPKNNEMPLSTQAIINYSFSFELHLKYILIRDNRFKKKIDEIHYTEKLFKRLSEKDQNEIISKFPLHLTKEFKELKIDFWTLLENESNAFVKWRYQHESVEHIYSNISFLRDLVKWTNYVAVKNYTPPK